MAKDYAWNNYYMPARKDKIRHYRLTRFKDNFDNVHVEKHELDHILDEATVYKRFIREDLCGAMVQTTKYDVVEYILLPCRHNYNVLLVCTLESTNTTIPGSSGAIHLVFVVGERLQIIPTERHINMTSMVLRRIKEFSLNLADVACQSQQYQCDDMSCILLAAVCDGYRDCSNGEDEQCSHVCSHTEQGSLDCLVDCHPDNCSCAFTHFQCQSGGCITMERVCDSLDDCSDATDENGCIHTKHYYYRIEGMFIKKYRTSYQSKTHLYKCQDGTLIEARYVDDLLPDCPDADDEPMLSVLTVNDCFRGQLPCKPGHPKCFNASEKCIYDLDIDGKLQHCRNGGHLFGCESQTCRKQYKCGSSYCIPIHRLCDGNFDCPNKDDEHQCHRLVCVGLFKCKQGACVDPAFVCDGIVNCPKYADDERLCGLLACPRHCTCIGHSLSCEQGIQFIQLPEINFVISLKIRNQSIIHSNTFSHYKKLVHLDLSYNYINSLPSGKLSAFKSLHRLFSLDISYNHLTHLEYQCFAGLRSLKIIRLEGNPLVHLSSNIWPESENLRHLSLQFNITYLSPDAFLGLVNLHVLNISNFHLETVPGELFVHLTKLKVLDLCGNTFKELSTYLFQSC